MGQGVPENVICEGDVCRVVTPAEAAAHAASSVSKGHTVTESPLLALLGPKLSGHSGEVDTASLLGEGKVLGIYFSAHWCGPCRRFTPELADWYKNFKANHERKDDFEVVFTSMDKDSEAFNEYWGTMPWLAVPYKNRELQAALSKKFKVRGIPSFVILDAATGQVITANGTDAVMEDKEGKEFPWRPKPFSELLGDNLVDKSDVLHPTTAALEGKVKLVYFSAHWCPPCRGFTPVLADTYNHLKAAGKKVEAIFVSSDRDESSFKEYLGSMPWLALPFKERNAKAALSQMFDVQGIPTLVVLDEHDQVITTNGRGVVSQDPKGERFPWHPPPLELLDQDTVGAVNESTVLVALLGDGKAGAEAKARAEEILLEVAKGERAAKGDVTCMWGKRSDEMPAKIEAFLKDHASIALEKGDALVLLDLPSQAVYRCPTSGDALSAAVARDFLKGFKEGTLTKSSLG